MRMAPPLSHRFPLSFRHYHHRTPFSFLLSSTIPIPNPYPKISAMSLSSSSSPSSVEQLMSNLCFMIIIDCFYLGKQNPQLMRLIQDHQADFLRLMNERVEGGERNLQSHMTSAASQTVSVTFEEREAIARLEGMRFRRGVVLQVFFACNKNEELAANYLLDHMDEFENEDDEGLT